MVETATGYSSIPEGMEMKSLSFGKKVFGILLGGILEPLRFLL